MRLAWAGSCQTPRILRIFPSRSRAMGIRRLTRGDLTRRSSSERRRFESEVVAAALARGESANPIQIDNVFPVATLCLVN